MKKSLHEEKKESVNYKEMTKNMCFISKIEFKNVKKPFGDEL